MLAIAAFLIIVSEHPEAQNFWRTTFPLSLLTTLAFLGKTSGYVVLVAGYAVYFRAGVLAAAKQTIPDFTAAIRMRGRGAVHRLSCLQSFSDRFVGVYHGDGQHFRRLQRGDVLSAAGERLFESGTFHNPAGGFCPVWPVGRGALGSKRSPALRYRFLRA